MSSCLRFSACLAAALLLGAACSPRLIQLQETVPTVAYRGVAFDQIQAEDPSRITLRMHLKFAFRNPFGRPLPIPEHSFSLQLNGAEVPVALPPHPAFTVPARGQQTETYPVTLNLDPQGPLKARNLLGRDNQLSFTLRIRLNLSEFMQEFGSGYGLVLPETELTQALGAQERLRQYLGSYTLELTHEDSIRLPLLPVVLPAAGPGRVRFLGEMDTFRLSVFQDAFTPLIDPLLDLQYPANLRAPFIQQLQERQCPSGFNKTRPCLDLFSDAVTGFIDLSWPGDKGAMKSEWNTLKNTLVSPPGQGAGVLDHLTSTVMQGYGDELSLLRSQWEGFKQAAPMVVFPGDGIEGVQLEIPLTVQNPNQFPIELPYLASGLEWQQGGQLYRPAAMLVEPQGGQTLLGPGQSRTLVLRTELIWKDAGGLSALIQGGSLSPALRGETRVDLGYGPLKLKFNLQGVPLRLGQ
ncbi:MAG: LEA type 2 family protein [Bacteroidia bacterium]|nr:LEA type 2 family protein [Bacteroidia bacterium]